jgi:hypothetical protein
MSLKNSLSAIATLVGIVALMMAVPGVSHATGAAHGSVSREQSPRIVIAENDQAGASADAGSDSDSDSKDSDDETTAEDQDDSSDQTEQQSAGNAQVAPQFQNGDNDADDSGEEGKAGEAGEVPPMNAYPQQVNPNQ